MTRGINSTVAVRSSFTNQVIQLCIHNEQYNQSDQTVCLVSQSNQTVCPASQSDETVRPASRVNETVRLARLSDQTVRNVFFLIMFSIVD